MPSNSWLESAATMPLAFAMVREDPLLDVEVLAALPDPKRLLMVASGGCTAALLATCPGVEALHLVDPNPAQLELARLKLTRLRSHPPTFRRALLGHDPLSPEERAHFLGNTLSSFGSAEVVLTRGPDFAGRYELLFARLQEVLRPQADLLDALLRLTDPVEQSNRTAPGTLLGNALDAAYDDVLALPNLVRLFGEGATQNPVEPFSRHFARRTRATLATLPAATNPYLWLMLRGTLPPDVALPWFGDLPDRTPEQIVYFKGFMIEVLPHHQEAFDFIHLSNILDWLTPAEATRTLQLAWNALRPGGIVFIRQLNSTLDIPALGPAFHWDRDWADDLLRRDRSFFYRALHVGRKR